MTTNTAASLPVGTSTAMPPFRLEVIQEPAAFISLESEWSALAAAMPRPNVFLSWEWASTWWRHFGHSRRLCLVAARGRDGELAGVAPLVVARRGVLQVRSLEFLGFRGSRICADHLDFLAAEPNRSAIVSVLLGQIGKLPGWDICTLAGVAEDSPLRQHWSDMAGIHARQQPGETCYYLPLPATASELWETLRRDHPGTYANQTRDRRQMQRKFALQFQPVTHAEEVPAAMADLARLHGMAHGRKGEPGSFGLPEYRAYHDELAGLLAERGQLYLTRLLWQGECAAVIYGFIAGKTLYFYQSGFDPSKSGAGKLLLGWVIEDAVERLGLSEFDFLRGEEAYKLQWTECARHTLDLEGTRPTLRGQFTRGWKLTRAQVRNWRHRS